jgi:hypothetical protein
MIGMIAAIVVLQGANTLTPDETKAGWKLLFDGKTTAGWHNFKMKTVKPGWAVKDGTLTVVDVDQAGDILTDEKFDWFELTLDYNLGKGQNSGIMFRVADAGDATWHSGPEVQLYDDQGVEGAEKSGWLYQLYKSPVDSAKPAGEWNHLRMLVSPTKCETSINDVKYYEYVLGSDDFKSRVAKSKFNEFPNFGKLPTGSIAIQGDHGVVSFRNIKIRPITP